MKPRNPKAFPDPKRGAEQSYNNQTPSLEEKGMTLRDYFAGKSMNGIISSNSSYYFGNSEGQMVPDAVAKESYEIADAMLKERTK